MKKKSAIGKTDICTISQSLETRALIRGGGGDEYSYLRVTSDVFLSKATLITTDFNRNSSGRMRCSSLW